MRWCGCPLPASRFPVRPAGRWLPPRHPALRPPGRLQSRWCGSPLPVSPIPVRPAVTPPAPGPLRPPPSPLSAPPGSSPKGPLPLPGPPGSPQPPCGPTGLPREGPLPIPRLPAGTPQGRRLPLRPPLLPRHNRPGWQRCAGRFHPGTPEWRVFPPGPCPAVPSGLRWPALFFVMSISLSRFRLALLPVRQPVNRCGDRILRGRPWLQTVPVGLIPVPNRFLQHVLPPSCGLSRFVRRPGVRPRGTGSTHLPFQRTRTNRRASFRSLRSGARWMRSIR